jgi:serine/threonine protein kinase
MNLLKVDPQERFSASQALEHPFYADERLMRKGPMTVGPGQDGDLMYDLAVETALWEDAFSKV